MRDEGKCPAPVHVTPSVSQSEDINLSTMMAVLPSVSATGRLNEMKWLLLEQTDRQSDRQAVRQTSTQTDRQTKAVSMTATN